MSAADLWLPSTRKVAIFRALNLGDLLCSIPALRAVRRALPAASIALVGLDGMRPLMRRFRHYVDEFVDFPGDPAFPEQAACVARLPEFYRYMRAQGFDLALQMHGSGIQSNAIVGKFGAKQWAGFVPLQSQQTPQLMTWPDRQPEIKRYLALLEYLGLPEQDASLEFPLDDADREAAAEVARQAGIEAAACLYALDHHIERLADDHANARALARGLAQIEGVRVQQPQTNLVFFEFDNPLAPERLIATLRQHGILLTTLGGRLRACTHLDVDAAMIEETIAVVRDAMRKN